MPKLTCKVAQLYTLTLPIKHVNFLMLPQYDTKICRECKNERLCGTERTFYLLAVQHIAIRFVFLFLYAGKFEEMFWNVDRNSFFLVGEVGYDKRKLFPRMAYKSILAMQVSVDIHQVVEAFACVGLLLSQLQNTFVGLLQ